MPYERSLIRSSIGRSPYVLSDLAKEVRKTHFPHLVERLVENVDRVDVARYLVIRQYVRIRTCASSDTLKRTIV